MKPEWTLRNEEFQSALRAGFRGDYIDWLEAEVLRLKRERGQSDCTQDGPRVAAAAGAQGLDG